MTSAQPISVQLQPYLTQGLQLWLEGDMLRFKATKEMLTPALMGLLKQNKEAIIAWLKSEAGNVETAPVLVEEYPLAFTQGAIWMLYRFAPNSPAYNTTFACTLKGDINESAVRKAFHALLIRHPVLRSTFADTDQGPRQKVWDFISMPLQILDAGQWTEAELDQQLDQEADAAFDLQTQSCLRVKLIRNSVRGNILIATIHHVGADLWALLIVAKDIREFYQRAANGEALSMEPAAVSYRQHVEWQQQFMTSERGKKERRFWQRALQGAPMTVTLPTDFTRPLVLQLKTRALQLKLEGDAYRAIKQFCKANSITPFVYVQSALQIMVHHFTGAADFLIGTPTMGRSQKGMDQVVGDFANPVVLRANIDAASALTKVFSRVRRNLLAAMEHQEYPFPSVVQDCNPPRDSSRTPLFQIMFVWHQGNIDMMAQDDWIESVLPMSGPRGAPYDVMLAVSDLGDRLELNWTYQTSLYQPESVDQYAGWLQLMLQQLLNDPLQTVADCIANVQVAAGSKSQPAPMPVSVLPEQVQSWLQQWELTQKKAISGISLLAEGVSHCAPHETGQVMLHTAQESVLTPILAQYAIAGASHSNSQHSLPALALVGLLPGFGIHQQQWLDLEQLLQSQYPLLRVFEHTVVTQSHNQQRWVQRVFVACADPAKVKILRQQFSVLPAWLDDFIILPHLPHTSSGAIDVNQLRQSPWVDHAAIALKMQQTGKPADDVVVVRQRVLLPSVDADETTAFLKKSALVKAPLKTLDISQRADAWVVGSALKPAPDAPVHLFAALQQTAQRFPDRGLVLHDDQRNPVHYSYARLVDDAHTAAAGLQRAGLVAGAIILLQMRFDQRFFAVWWGAVLAGIRPLNVATPDHFSERNGVAQKLYNVAHNFAELTVVADQNRVTDTQRWLGDSKRVIDADNLLQHSEQYRYSALSTDPVAFLQLTSGSTGTPKAIQITHHGILHHIAASAAHNGYSSDDINLNWLPFDHVVPILTTHIKDCVLGIQQIQLTTSSVLSDPIWWLQAMSDYGATHSWAPNFAFQRVVEALNELQVLPDLDLGRIRFLMNAGEQVLAPVVKRFASACAAFGLNEHVVQPAFGMAEACTCITYNNNSSDLLSVHFNNTLDPAICDIADSSRATHGFVDLGTLMPGVEIRITNEHNQLVKEGVIGRMQIRGPVVTPGYLNNADANAEAFVGDGWFNSGDLGIIWNQRLILTGREKEMIVVYGANYYCFEVEQAVTIPGVLPTFVAAAGVALEQGGNSDGLVLFYVSDHSVDATELERQMRARATEAFSVVPAFIIEVEPENFYKTTSGKIQRGQFKKNFEKDLYSKEVASYLQRHQEPGDHVDTLFQLHWDSVAAPVAGEPAYPWTILHTASATQPGWLKTARESGCQCLAWDGQTLPSRLTDLQTDSSNVLLLLDAVSDANSGSVNALDQSLLALTRQVAIVKTGLQGIDTALAGRIIIAMPGASQQELLLFKPLLETLRQETGLSSLRGCVIADTCAATPAFFLQLQQLESWVHWIDTDRAAAARLASVNLNAMGPSALVRNGVYVITGGLGGLAAPLIEFLVTQHRCRLVLVGRSEIEHSRRHESRLRQLQDQFGADHIQYCTLPDWSQATLTATINQGLQLLNGKQLEGVFHLAGHLQMEPLESLSIDNWYSTMGAKLQGSIALAEYLQQHWPTSILVQYASLNGYFGGQNAAVYSMANAVQTRLTRHLNQHTRIRTWCMHWSVWQGTGMAQQFSAAELQMARNKGLMALDKKRDLLWLQAALQLTPDCYYIGIDAGSSAMGSQLDSYQNTVETLSIHLHDETSADKPDAALREWAQAVVVEVSPRVASARIETRLWRDSWPRDTQGHVDIDLLMSSANSSDSHRVPPANVTESTLAEIWASVLGRDIPDVTRSFFDYGGHSINATQLVAAINRQFEASLSVAHLFQFSSIRELAGLLGAAEPRHNQFLSLSLQDCIERSDAYRLDAVNPESQSTLNVVFLPTAAGIPSAYLQLVARLTKFRLHVLAMPLKELSERPIADAADEFIKLMLDTALDLEHTLLVGWSMGGVLGYEMLTQLSRKGRPLPGLVMLDSGFGVGLHTITFDEQFQLLMFAVECGLTLDQFATFNQQADLQAKLSWLQQYLVTIGIEVTLPLLLDWCDAYRKRLHSLETYGMGDALANADITLIKAALHPHGRDDLGWGESNKNIKWQTVQADHQSIVKHHEVAERLHKLCLESEIANGTQ